MKTALLVFVLSLAACVTDEHAEERADASRWDSLAHGLAALSAQYCADEAWSQPSCADAAGQYAAEARRRVDEVHAMAARMDGHMATLGLTERADSTCTADALGSEVDRHGVAACGASAGDGEAEARRHCAAVLELAAQMHLRSGVVMRALRTTYYSGSGSMGMVPRQTSAGLHDWPWAVGEQPVAVPVCAAAP